MSRQAGASHDPRPASHRPGALRRGLDREGLTVEEFAYLFGVSSKTVYRWLLGTSIPRRRHARLLAERFGGHWTDYLYPDHDEELTAA